jgi:NADH-quinone oxidoreductase subunit N
VVIGSVLAVVQTNVKRMLAYSSITHAGYILVGLEAAAHHAGEGPARLGPGVPAMAFYLLAYAVIITGTFGVVALVARTGDGRTDLDDFRGLGRRHPALALALTIFLVAQAGVPFTSGFVAKFGVISAAVDERSYALALIAMLASVIGAFLYLRIMVSAWMQDEDHEHRPGEATAEAVTIPVATGMFIAASALFTLVVGIVPGWLLDAADVTVAFAR